MSDRLQDEHQAVAEEEAHRLQVHGRARHQLAGLLVVEEAELEPLELAVHQLAQVVLDRRARRRPAIIRRHDGQAPARQHDARGSRSRASAACGARGRARRAWCSAAVAPCWIASTAPPGERRQRDGHDHRQARQDPGDGQPAPVGAQESEQSPEERSALIVVRATIIAPTRRAEPGAARHLSWAAQVSETADRADRLRRSGAWGCARPV